MALEAGPQIARITRKEIIHAPPLLEEMWWHCLGKLGTVDGASSMAEYGSAMHSV